MASNDLKTLMSVTNRDMETASRALHQADGDVGAAVERLLGGERSLAGNRMVRRGGGGEVQDVTDGEIRNSRVTQRWEDSGNGYLTLKVVRPSQETESLEIHFRVKQSTQMGKLKRSYSERVGVSMGSLRFLYDGKRISDEATPGILEMESGDCIEVYKELGLGTSDTTEGVESVTAVELREHRVRRQGDFNTQLDRELQDVQLEVDRDREREIVKTKRMSRTLSQETEGMASVKRRRLGEESLREELEKVQRKYQDLVKKLRDKVECPVCFDVPRKAPIPVCPNGHVVCVRCVRAECPTCRVNMEQGTSTLAVTVVENIEHQCDNEGCGLSFHLKELADHAIKCEHRRVQCPGLDCTTTITVASLRDHVINCCVERAEIRHYKLPHRFTYMMNEEVKDLSGENQNFMWRLEGLKFEENIFFLKVTRKARKGRWFFFVQMVGNAEETSKFAVTIAVFRPEDSGEGKYSQRYSGDICPIDVCSVDDAEDLGYCLTIKDGGMAKLFVKNDTSGENEFSVSVNIFRN